MAVNVLEEILKWSADRPAWQRDALRRLLVDGGLTESDVSELVEICKSGYVLSDVGNGTPLEKSHSG